MQNKGAIRLFAIALALISVFQLWFTVKTVTIENDAKEYANGDIKKERAYLDSISGEVVYSFLGLRDYTYSECKEKEINLGLDLKGGMNVTLEVSVVDIIKSMANNPSDTTFNNAIELAKKMQENAQEDYVTLFGKAFEQIDPNAKLAAIFNTVELRGVINYNSTNEEVLEVIRNETQGAIDNSFNILRTRIDRFGVAQPNIQRLETSGRILVELPGVKDPERVRKLLQGTAKLEFWETFENQEVYQYLAAANSKIKEIEDAKAGLNEAKAKHDSTATEVVENPAPAEESNLLSLNDSTNTDTTKEVSLLEKLNSDSLANDSASMANPELVKKNYPLFSVLSPWTTREGQLMQGPIVGISHVKDTSKVNEYLAMKQVKSLFPRNLKFLWTIKAYDKEGNFYQLIAIKISSRDGKAPLDGDAITNARAEFGNGNAVANVSMQMNADGAKVWARLTKDAASLSPKRCIAIVLDDYVYSFPTVQNEIKGGSSQITGNFTVNEAKDLANVLKSGKLPAPARIIEEAIVGPSLGIEAINSGFMSFIIAFLIVLLYMIFYYSKAGLVANVALVSNVFFIMGVLASLGAVLTLPGIAGIVLTIGMSVDANVLIYERIREEIAAGKGLKLAITDGYNNAYSAIIDGNVTTLLTGIVLYVFGSGPVQGFATTLIIGIVTSLFSAIFITRIIFETMLRKNGTISYATKLTENAFKNLKVNFLGKRKIAYVISTIVIIAGIASLATRGLNYGVDFKGGRSYIVRFDEKVSTVDIAKELQVVFGEAPEVKTFGAGNQVKITTKYLIDESTDSTDYVVEKTLFEGLKTTIGENVDFNKFINDYRMSSQKVGPTIADDIKVSALWAIIFALIIIFVYILVRFKNWQYGLGAVVALAHDVLFVLALFSLLYGFLPFSLEVDQAFIAAILTVIGYSINDTVIIFDRIREYVGLHKKRDRAEVMNSALNDTLSRTFSTSFSTFIVLLIIFIFGGEVIRGFTFALLIGVIVGTYSSLFVATPIVFDLMKKEDKQIDKK